MKIFDWSMWLRSDSAWLRSDSALRSDRFTRLTATVTMSAPEARCASAITRWDGYFPVPTMRRERKVLSAMVRRSVAISVLSVLSVALVVRVVGALASADEVHDLYFIPLAHDDRLVFVALDDDEIVLDRDQAGVNLSGRRAGR